MEGTKFRLGGGGLFPRVLPTRLVESVSGRLGTVAIAWVPLLVLCVIAGNAVGNRVNITFLGDPIPYARLIISLPLFMLAEVVVNGRLSAVVAYIWESGILVGDDRRRFQESIAEVDRRRRSIAADIVFLLIAYAMAWTIGSLDVHDGYSSWFAYDKGAGQVMSAAGWWYTFVSLPLYQLLLLRWIWRVLLWWIFLWRMSRLKLRLLPSHPDRAGGLGILEMGQNSFVILVFAISAVLASELADVKYRESFTLLNALPTIIVYLVLCLLCVLGPLLVFAGQLVQARRRGLIEYGDLADDLFGAFAERWTEKSDVEQQKLLGNVDPSSLADYGYVYEVVTAMRVMPFSLSSVMHLAGVALLPFAPLLLMEHSWKEIVQRIFAILG